MVGQRFSQTTDSTAKQSDADCGAVEMLEDVCSDRHYVNGENSATAEETELKKRVEHVIEGEIIPRLMLLHRTDPTITSTPADAPPDLSEHLPEFTKLILSEETEAIAAYLDVLMQKGATLDGVLLHLMAPAARQLGAMWEDDTLDFVDVTIGVSRLQQLLHRLTFAFEKTGDEPERRVLLLPTPSEQHTFGLLMVSDFFRRNGWHVVSTPPLSPDEISQVVSEQWFALIGFSLSCERLIDTLSSTIESVRQGSRNQSIKIVVGGSIFAQTPELKPRVDADMVVTDVQQAVLLAESALTSGVAKIR